MESIWIWLGIDVIQNVWKNHMTDIFGTPWKINMEPTNHPFIERKMIFQASMIMFHFNLQGCRFWPSILTASIGHEVNIEKPNPQCRMRRMCPSCHQTIPSISVLPQCQRSVHKIFWLVGHTINVCYICYVYLGLVDFYAFHVGKLCPSSHGCVMGWLWKAANLTTWNVAPSHWWIGWFTFSANSSQLKIEHFKRI